MCKSSDPYTPLGIASTTLPISAITFEEVIARPDTSTTSESAPASATRPSKLPSPALPDHIEVSVACATSAATRAITKSENNGGSSSKAEKPI